VHAFTRSCGYTSFCVTVWSVSVQPPDWMLRAGGDIAANWTTHHLAQRNFTVASNLNLAVLHVEEASRLGGRSSRLMLVRGNVAAAMNELMGAVV
jgi:hypothetical protein